MKKGTLRGLLCAGLLVVLTACGGGSKFDVSIKENIETEYGEELDHSILFDSEKSEKDIAVKEVKDFDPKKIGEQEITVVFALGDETQEETVKVNVKDTKAPEITFKSETVEIALRDSFDAASNLESVKDPVDGVIAQSNDNTITESGYYFGGDPIASEVGEYTVTVIAFDKNGNRAEKSYKLVIKEKSQETSSTTQPQQNAPTQSGSQAPSQSNQSSSGSSSSSSQPAPSQPKTVCPNGNEPKNPDLPCDAFISGSYNEAYRDASGNIMAFPNAEAAWDWAYDVMSNDKAFDIYSSFATLPLGKNDGTQCDGVVFFK